jgi:hypothetical protein
MAKLNTDGTVGKAIVAYLGIPSHALKSLECYPDPMVTGTFAFRAMVEEFKGVSLNDWDGTNHAAPKLRAYDFLTIGLPLAKVTDEDLEECDWETWPPKSEGRITSWVVR